MHSRAVWADLSGTLLWCRGKYATVLLLIILPVVLTQETIPVLEGDSISLPCELSCDDPNCLLWTYKGPQDESFQIGSCSGECGGCRTECPLTWAGQCAERPAIYFQDTRRSCAAVYQCQVYEGSTQPYGVRLDVYYPPESVQIQSEHTSTDIYVNIGDRLDLDCTVGESNPSPTVSWLKNGELLLEGDSTLVIEQVGEADLGVYVCEARSDSPGFDLDWRVASDPVTVYVHVDAHMTTTDTTTSHMDTTQHVTTKKTTTTITTTKMAGTADSEASAQENSSPKEHQVLTIGVVLSAFGGLILLASATWVCKRRKATTSEENGTSGDDSAPRQETSLPILLPEFNIQTFETGLTSDVDCPPSAVGLPVQVSSICPYEPEQNQRLPIMVSLKMTTPQQRVGQHENPAFNRGERSQTRPKVATPNNTLPKVASPENTLPKVTAPDNTLPIVANTDNTPDRVLHLNEEPPRAPKEKRRAANNAPDRVLHLNEETSLKINPRASQVANKRCNCRSAFSSTSSDKATRPKALANARQREDARRSVSLDESTLSEPHTLCSNLPDSVSCPLLDEMISGRSVTKKEPQIPRVSTSREGRCEEKRSPGGHREATGQKAGFFGSMETITEDTAQVHAVKKKTPLGNQNGRTSLDVEALSLGGNKVATTIVQMIKKQLVDKTHFDLPYSKFSALCLRLYNTGSNWKILAGKLGLTVEDVVLIDNCSAQHGLLAAEIVLLHWQRTADQNDMAPCNLGNLQGILGDMGREDLVEMLTN